MSKKLQAKLLLIAFIIIILLMILQNFQLANIIARLERMDMKNKNTEYLVTMTI